MGTPPSLSGYILSALAGVLLATGVFDNFLGLITADQFLRLFPQSSAEPAHPENSSQQTLIALARAIDCRQPKSFRRRTHRLFKRASHCRCKRITARITSRHCQEFLKSTAQSASRTLHRRCIAKRKQENTSFQTRFVLLGVVMSRQTPTPLSSGYPNSTRN